MDQLELSLEIRHEESDEPSDFCIDHSVLESDIGAEALRKEFVVELVKRAFGMSRGGRARRPSISAMAWIASNDETHPFSFENCCDVWGADPDAIRNSLEYYKRKLEIS